MKEEVVFIISSLGLSTEQWTAECVCRMCIRSCSLLRVVQGVTASQTEQRPWPGGKQIMPMIVSSTFSCKYIAKHSTLSFKCGTWRVVMWISIYQPKSNSSVGIFFFRETEKGKYSVRHNGQTPPPLCAGILTPAPAIVQSNETIL